MQTATLVHAVIVTSVIAVFKPALSPCFNLHSIIPSITGGLSVTRLSVSLCDGELRSCIASR